MTAYGFEHKTILIDEKALLSNIRKFGKSTIAVLKGNAYGHGIRVIGDILSTCATVDMFMVGTPDEADMLVRYRKPVVLLYWNTPHKHGNIVHVVSNGSQLLRLVNTCPTSKRVIVEVDTGLNRSGFKPNQIKDVCAHLVRAGFEIVTLMSHYYGAQESKEKANALMDTQEQLLTGMTAYPVSFGSSSSIQQGRTFGILKRIGSLMYGISTLPNTIGLNYGVKPVMTVKTRIQCLNDLQAGDAFGYGNFVQEKCTIGIVPFGYADGYPRITMTQAEKPVMFAQGTMFGQDTWIACKVLSVSMNHSYLLIQNASIKPYAEVTVFGAMSGLAYDESLRTNNKGTGVLESIDGRSYYTVEQVANATNHYPLEILTSMRL